jgi:L-threonylcarbamoyladenylate synthase
LRDYLNAQRHAGHRCAVLAYSQPALVESLHRWRMMPAEPAAYAHDLYAAMRELDAAGAKSIVIEAPPGGDAWQAVTDRLRRASVGSGKAANDDRP